MCPKWVMRIYLSKLFVTYHMWIYWFFSFLLYIIRLLMSLHIYKAFHAIIVQLNVGMLSLASALNCVRINIDWVCIFRLLFLWIQVHLTMWPLSINCTRTMRSTQHLLMNLDLSDIASVKKFFYFVHTFAIVL